MHRQGYGEGCCRGGFLRCSIRLHLPVSGAALRGNEREFTCVGAIELNEQVPRVKQVQNGLWSFVVVYGPEQSVASGVLGDH